MFVRSLVATAARPMAQRLASSLGVRAFATTVGSLPPLPYLHGDVKTLEVNIDPAEPSMHDSTVVASDAYFTRR